MEGGEGQKDLTSQCISEMQIYFFPEIQIWVKNVDTFSDAIIWRGNFTATVVSADSQIEDDEV